MLHSLEWGITAALGRPDEEKPEDACSEGTASFLL